MEMSSILRPLEATTPENVDARKHSVTHLERIVRKHSVKHLGAHRAEAQRHAPWSSSYGSTATRTVELIAVLHVLGSTTPQSEDAQSRGAKNLSANNLLISSQNTTIQIKMHRSTIPRILHPAVCQTNTAWCQDAKSIPAP